MRGAHVRHVRFGLGIVLACLSARLSLAELVRGTAIVPPDGSSFLAKFCYDVKSDMDNVAGIINVTVWVTNLHSVRRDIHIATFDDQSESYPGNSIAWDHMTCDERKQRARGWHVLTEGTTLQINVFEHARERFWFLSIMDCTGEPLELTYEVHMLNTARGFQQEFSMDHIGILPLSILLLLVYCSLALLQLRNNAVSHKMWGQGWVSHPMVRMLTMSLLCFAFAALLFCVHYGVFAMGGRGVVLFYVVAKFVQALAKCLLMTMLLLLARGRCISSAMSFDDVRWMLKVLLPFLLFCVGLELWGENAESRKYTTGFVYHTKIGCLLVAVDVFLFCFFSWSLYSTHSVEGDSEKRFFYKALGLSCAMWFLTLPFSAFLALLLSPWVRFKVLMLITHLSHAVACAVIVAILRPSNSTYMEAMSDGCSDGSVTPSLLGSECGGLKPGKQSNGFKLVLSPLQENLENVS